VEEVEVGGAPAVVPEVTGARGSPAWASTCSTNAIPFRRLRPVKQCEVAVVGAGIVGVATAWELHARGVDVALVDRGEVSGATTGLGEGNVLCSDKGVGPELELTLAGLGLYDELEALLGDRARIRRKGALVVHRAAGDLGRRGGCAWSTCAPPARTVTSWT
jgi:NADPH-dependent 2,4-dienoyl-CoA reductase/sulfur reductase-like enzyme